MDHSFRRIRFTITFSFLALCGLATAAQTVAIGTGTAKQGESVSLPVNLAATMDCTALLLRLQFDPAVLENPSVTAGDLMGTGHTIDCFSPEPGRVNIAIYATDGAPAFTAQSGNLFHLNFQIKTAAPTGDTQINRTTIGTDVLPTANLIKTTGIEAGVSVTPGRVTVEQQAGTGRSWRQYR